MNTDRQAEVVRVVWPWREPTVIVCDDVSHRRKSAVIESAVGFVVSAIFLYFGKQVVGTIVLCIATTVLLSGLFYRPVYDGIKKAGLWLAKIVGAGTTWLLLVPFFYLCFPVGRLCFMLLGKDPMTRRLESERDSYWTPKQAISGTDHYIRQY